MTGLASYSHAIACLAPEICLVVTILIVTLWNLFVPKAKEFTPTWCVIGLGTAFVYLLSQLPRQPVTIFQGLYTIDPLTITFGLIVLLVGIMVVLMTMGYEHHFGNDRGEFYAILLTAVLAVMLLAGTTDLIMLFVGLETLSICCVLLAGFGKHDVKSNEASLKYLLSTAAVTATFLYGLSFAYGLTGSTAYAQLAEKFLMPSLPPHSLMQVLIVVLILSAVGFKLSMVPFHMWTPDVYEGAPTPVTAFLSIGSKLGGFVVALRLLMVVFGRSTADWTLLIAAFAVLSMCMGNFIALAQKSLKRMLAYSSIAHIGYMLIGLVAGSPIGLSMMVFYIVVYAFMNLGAFAGAILFSNETGSDSIDDMEGYVRKRPWAALLLSVCLLNLAGLPIPPAGFFAKILIFSAGLEASGRIYGVPIGWLLIAVALVTSILGVFYYTRVVIKMVVREPSAKVAALPNIADDLESPQSPVFGALAISVVVLLIAGTVCVQPLVEFSQMAVQPLVGSSNERTQPIGYLPRHLE